MFDREKVKEEVKKVQEQLIQELGEDEFKRIFEQTRKDLMARFGFWSQPSWENVVLTVAERLQTKLSQGRIVKMAPGGFKASIEHDGQYWRVYYYRIDSFENDLLVFGKFLESIDERGETVSAIIPNTGFVGASVILGTSFQGVKGFAVITRKGK